MATKYLTKYGKVLFDTTGLAATTDYSAATTVSVGDWLVVAENAGNAVTAGTNVSPTVTTTTAVGTLVKVTTATIPTGTGLVFHKITPAKFENRKSFAYSPTPTTVDVSDAESGFAKDELTTGFDTKFSLDAWYTKGTVQELAIANIEDTTEFWVIFCDKVASGENMWAAKARGIAMIDRSGEVVGCKFDGVFTIMPLKQAQTSDTVTVFA